MAAFGGGNPFASGGNPFGGGGGLKGGLGMLKKKAKPKSFEELNISVIKEEQWKKNATARMREIDTFRLHVPEEGERRQFSIPESTDRVNTQDCKHLMVLCGGYAGVRFSSEDLALIRTSTKELSEKFTCLDSYFKSLPNSVKRISLSEEVIASSSSGSSQFDKGNDEGKEMDTDAAEEKSREDKDTTVKEQEQEQVERKVVVTFHGLADAVHDVLASIQGLVSRKHAEFTLAQASSGGGSPQGQSQGEAGGDGEGEGEESLSSKPRPVWLETLLCKYIREVTHANTTNSSGSGSSRASGSSGSERGEMSLPLPPVGSLCAFLSCCALRQVSTTQAEDEAMLELIQASSDFAAPCVGNLPTNIEEEIFSHTQKYWAQRFFVFMKKLTELKTAMKDEKSLFLFEKFYL